MQSGPPSPHQKDCSAKTLTKQDQRKPSQVGLRKGESQNEATLRGINGPEKGEDAALAKPCVAGVGITLTDVVTRTGDRHKHADRCSFSLPSSRGRGSLHGQGLSVEMAMRLAPPGVAWLVEHTGLASGPWRGGRFPSPAPSRPHGMPHFPPMFFNPGTNGTKMNILSGQPLKRRQQVSGGKGEGGPSLALRVERACL